MFSNTTRFKDWLRESALHFDKTKALGRKTRHYKNGDQLDATIKTILANRGQPEQYENQIEKHYNSIIGFKDDRDVEIKLYGTEVRDRAGADMLNAVIKTIRDTTNYEDEVEALDDELAIEGVAYAELTIDALGEFDRFGREHKDVQAKHVPSIEMFPDPFSRAKNYNDDARYLTRAFWIDHEDLYGFGFDETLVDALSNTNYLSDIVDNDLYANETIRKRVLFCYTWYRKFNKKTKQDEFFYCFWSDNTILLQDISPYSFKGFPYEVEFLNRDFSADIKYWGLFRHIMPLQDHINFAKLRLQNMLGSNKTLVNRGAIENNDIVQFNAEWSLDNSTVLVEDINGIKDVKQTMQIDQILNIIIDARNQITELLNSNKEILGNANNRMSGVGQERRIKSALVGLSKFTNRSDALQKKIIKKMVEFIKQYYNAERIFSIIDDEYMQDFLTMNETITNQYGGIDFTKHDDGTLSPLAKNRIDIGKYDLVFLAKPSSDTMSAERLKQNVELLKVLQITDPTLVKYLVPDILKDSDSPSAMKIKKIIEAQQMQNTNSPEAQKEAQISESERQLEMIYKQSQTNLNNAKAKALDDKNRIDLQKAFSHSIIASEGVKEKMQRNQLNSLRGVRS
ncbi:MAG: hypothetical protein ACMV1K_05105 [Sulfurospirillum sp.]